MRRLHLAVAAVALCGCASVELAPSDLRTRRGPAAARPVRRVVAMPATCGTLAFPPPPSPAEATPPQPPSAPDPANPYQAWRIFSLCDDAQMAGVDARVRALLEFRGLDVIDSERLNAEPRRRVERSEETTWRVGAEPPATSGSREIDIEGARFIDATPAMQEAIAHELGADGLLNTRIWIGSPEGMAGRRSVEVQVRLLHLPEQEMVWASRCAVEIGGVESDSQGMERAARCAVEGALAP
ncbi:MAG TPA: hypothetical protein VMZ28_14715 [Kofleriaceae bacterium]|nr:hypothetical protein [Kofleriaceae bacterium]